MQNVKNTIVDELLSWVAPHPCFGCGELGSALCNNCKYNITMDEYQHCIQCGRLQMDGICAEHTVAYSKAWCVGERSGVLQRLIGAYKFRSVRSAHQDLAALLDIQLPVLPVDTVVVPVPTISAHVRERGFDHIELVARRFAKNRQLTVGHALSRVNTAAQHHSSRRARQQEAAKAFEVNSPLSPDVPYLLMDDVVTTGATLKHAARLLRAAGAKTIWVGVIAKQPLDS